MSFEPCLTVVVLHRRRVEDSSRKHWQQQEFSSILRTSSWCAVPPFLCFGERANRCDERCEVCRRSSPLRVCVLAVSAL